MSALLSTRNVETYYGPIMAIGGVSIDVPEGRMVCVLGANGAGKTTLLRTISGLVQARSGKVNAFGSSSLVGWSAARIVRAGVGHVPEGRQLFPLMTVRENLESGAEYLSRAKPNAARNRKLVFDLFPRLAERGAQLAGTLSGGERQMLAIGRALMSDPRLLLVDEPSLGLSPALSLTVFRALKQINREGVTVVLVEQNVQQSLRIADRAYVLENGEVVKEGSGRELLGDPGVRAAYLSM